MEGVHLWYIVIFRKAACFILVVLGFFFFFFVPIEDQVDDGDHVGCDYHLDWKID